MIDRLRFQEYVQESLAHLYDYSYLQTHPLAAVVAEGLVAETRGRTLYRLLVGAIDILKPDSNAPAESPAWRKYHCLFRRYVEGVGPEKVASELGVTPRQARRDQHEALEAIADILYARYEASARPGGTRNDRPMGTAATGSPESASRESESESESDPDAILESELSRLAADSPRGPAQLAEVVAGTLATVSRLADSLGIVITLATPAELPGVAVDRSLLRQVLLSLLNYGIELPGATHLDLVAREFSEFARLSITVAGVSFLPKSDYRLGMCQRLLALQDGVLAVESTGPLVLTLTLPLQRVATVLIVDDNPDVCLLFQRYLDRTYRVVQAHSATEALALLREVRPDVVTLDVLMPSSDGWELLQQIRADEAAHDVPVIVCSVVRDGSLALSLGATEHLPKPISREGLRSALERCLRHRA